MAIVPLEKIWNVKDLEEAARGLLLGKSRKTGNLE